MNIYHIWAHINIYCNPHPFRSLVSPNQIRPAFVHVLLVRRTDLFSQAIQASLFGFWLLMDLVKLLVHLVKIQKESQLSRHSSSLSTWRIWVHSPQTKNMFSVIFVSTKELRLDQSLLDFFQGSIIFSHQCICGALNQPGHLENLGPIVWRSGFIVWVVSKLGDE